VRSNDSSRKDPDESRVSSLSLSMKETWMDSAQGARITEQMLFPYPPFSFQSLLRSAICLDRRFDRKRCVDDPLSRIIKFGLNWSAKQSAKMSKRSASIPSSISKLKRE